MQEKQYLVFTLQIGTLGVFVDVCGDQETEGGVTGQYSDFWNTALSYTNGFGASWSSNTGFSAFGSDLEGFTRGAETMSNSGSWGDE